MRNKKTNLLPGFYTNLPAVTWRVGLPTTSYKTGRLRFGSVSENINFCLNQSSNPNHLYQARGPGLKLAGTLRMEGMLANTGNPLQSMPPSYLRFFWDQQVQVGIVPVNLTMLISTGQRGVSHQMNAFGFSFNQPAFQAGLKESLMNKMKAEARKKNREEFSVPMEMKVDARLSELSSLLQAPHILLNRPDSLLPDSFSGLGAKPKPELLARLRWQQEFDSLANLKQKMKLASLNAELSVNREAIVFDDPRALQSKLKEHGLYKPEYKFLFALQKFELGTCSPQYGHLILNNTLLMGANIEYNPGYWYAGGVAGQLVNYNVTQPFTNGANFRSTAYAVKGGFGRLTQNHIGFTLAHFKSGLSGTIDSSEMLLYPGNTVQQNSYTDNSVFGFEGQYFFTKDFKVYAELSTSNNALSVANTGTEDLGKTESKLAKGLFTNEGRRAMLVNSTYEIRQTRTRLFAEYRSVDPFYFSAGSSYLRRDNRKLEFRINQYVLKNKLTCSFSVRNDQDNLLNHKRYTTTSLLYCFNSLFRPVNFYFLSATSSFGKQEVKSGTEQGYYAGIRMLSLINGFNYKIFGQQAFTSAGCILQEYQSDNVLLNKSITQVCLDQSVTLINRCNLVLSSGVFYTLPGGTSDSSGVFNSTVSVSGLVKKSFNVSAGYAYTRDISFLSRTGFNLGLRYHSKHAGSFELRFNRMMYDYAPLVKQPDFMQTQAYLTYSKSF